jgi:hypothetical protein
VADVRLHLQRDAVDTETIDVWVDCFVADEAVRFRLDTGAPVCRVDSSEATRELPSSGIQMSTHIARMKACRIGGIEFAPSACAIVDLGPLNIALQQRAAEEQRMIQPVSFIAGMPVISQADWTFDFPAARWTVNQLHAE